MWVRKIMRVFLGHLFALHFVSTLQFFLLEASCDLNRKYDLIIVGALTYSGIHITYSPLRLTELQGLVGPPEVCAWALRMLFVKEEGMHTSCSTLCAPLSHCLHLQTPPEDKIKSCWMMTESRALNQACTPLSTSLGNYTVHMPRTPALMLRPGLQPDPSLLFCALD